MLVAKHKPSFVSRGLTGDSRLWTLSGVFTQGTSSFQLLSTFLDIATELYLLRLKRIFSTKGTLK